MKRLGYFIMFIVLPSWGATQTAGQFGKRLVAGTSLTYIWDRDRDIQNTYHETTWEENLAVSLTKSLYFGLSHKNIFTRGSRFLPDKNDQAQYNMFGAFVQYDFLPMPTGRLSAEVSYHAGDYCTCGRLDPYRLVGLRYVGWGQLMICPCPAVCL